MTLMYDISGPDTSQEFYLTDGQKLNISCSDNIQPSLEGKDHVCNILYTEDLVEDYHFSYEIEKEIW